MSLSLFQSQAKAQAAAASALPMGRRLDSPSDNASNATQQEPKRQKRRGTALTDTEKKEKRRQDRLKQRHLPPVVRTEDVSSMTTEKIRYVLKLLPWDVRRPGGADAGCAKARKVVKGFIRSRNGLIRFSQPAVGSEQALVEDIRNLG